MKPLLEVRESKRIWASPDDVWRVVRELDGLDAWLPWVASSRLSGDVRTTIASDTTMEPILERIVDFDDEHRAYSYEYLQGPLKFASYSARVQVLPFRPSQCEVTWSGSFAAMEESDEEKLCQLVSSIYRDSLAALRAHCVRAPDDTLSLPPTLG